MDLNQITHAENVRLSDDGRAVRILDQSLLPNQTVYLELSRAEDLYEAIASLRVRGAPAIGIFAGYALYVLALQSQADQYGPFVEECRKYREHESRYGKVYDRGSEKVEKGDAPSVSFFIHTVRTVRVP